MKPFEIPVSARYGAPMGRHSDNPANFEMRKTHLQRVDMHDYCYDKGGAYWGSGTPLWCAWSDAIGDEEFIVYYVRAETREEAKKYLEGAIFYR